MSVKHRENNFDGVRLLAATFVLVSHQFALSGRPEPMIRPPHSLGNLGVLMFFSISGFLVLTSWMNDPSPIRFLSRRFLRIWPGLVVVTLLVAGVAWFRAGRIFEPASMLAPVWLQVRGTRGGVYNGPVWTIPYEVACYFILCGLGWTARARLPQLLALTALVLLVWYVGSFGAQPAFERTDREGTLSFLPYFGAFFLAGALLATYAAFLRRAHWFWLAGIGCLFAHQTLLALLLLVPTVTVKIGVAQWPVVRSAGRFGDLSYGLYLYAWPVQVAVVGVLGTSTPVWKLVLASCLGVVPLALLSWRFVEKAALRLKPRRAREAAAPISVGPPAAANANHPV
jgi:peptidoglycan/LPS O-acetylase OafA/YrhL